MRELNRCIAWAAGLGAAALLLALFAGAGLAQTDGLWAWAVLAAYAPFYLLGHTFSPDPALAAPEPAFLALAVAAQFAYFACIVAVARYVYRRL